MNRTDSFSYVSIKYMWGTYFHALNMPGLVGALRRRKIQTSSEELGQYQYNDTI